MSTADERRARALAKAKASIPAHDADCPRRLGGPRRADCPGCEFFRRRDVKTSALFAQAREGYRPGPDADWNEQDGHWYPGPDSPAHEHRAYARWQARIDTPPVGA